MNPHRVARGSARGKRSSQSGRVGGLPWATHPHPGPAPPRSPPGPTSPGCRAHLCCTTGCWRDIYSRGAKCWGWTRMGNKGKWATGGQQPERPNTNTNPLCPVGGAGGALHGPPVQQPREPPRDSTWAEAGRGSKGGRKAGWAELGHACSTRGGSGLSRAWAGPHPDSFLGSGPRPTQITRLMIINDSYRPSLKKRHMCHTTCTFWAHRTQGHTWPPQHGLPAAPALMSPPPLSCDRLCRSFFLGTTGYSQALAAKNDQQDCALQMLQQGKASCPHRSRSAGTAPCVPLEGPPDVGFHLESSKGQALKSHKTVVPPDVKAVL